MISILDVDGFDWDSGNEFKSYDRHKINKKEAEEILDNYPLFFGREATLNVADKTELTFAP